MYYDAGLLPYLGHVPSAGPVWQAPCTVLDGTLLAPRGALCSFTLSLWVSRGALSVSSKGALETAALLGALTLVEWRAT